MQPLIHYATNLLQLEGATGQSSIVLSATPIALVGVKPLRAHTVGMKMNDKL